VRKFYNYNSATREYTSEDEADPNPLVPGDYLLPAYATFKPPPETIEVGKQAIFDLENDEWVVQDIPPPIIDLAANLREMDDDRFDTIGDLFNA